MRFEHGRESARIVVDQPTALADAVIRIELRGFPPRRPVRLTATQTFPNATRWQANATFTSDDHGDVDVTRQAPLAGVPWRESAASSTIKAAR